MKCAEVGSTTTLTQKSTCCKASRYFSLNISKNSSRYLSSEYFHTNQEFLGFPIYLDFQSLHCKWTFLSSEVHLFPQIVSKVGGDSFLGFPIIVNHCKQTFLSSYHWVFQRCTFSPNCKPMQVDESPFLGFPITRQLIGLISPPSKNCSNCKWTGILDLDFKPL